jgi:ATP-dependent DNA helicase PIF1
MNTIMCKAAKKASSWYVNTHRGDQCLTVEDIQEMINSGEAGNLANRLSHAGEKLSGTKSFWQKARKDIISMIRFPECGTPHVFFTASSADIQ